MLPAFDDFGNLPPGIHRCQIDELVSRFGQGSEERQAEISELVNFIERAKAAGIRRVLVNGSFVTGKLAPNDVDVVILPGNSDEGPGGEIDVEPSTWPFLQIIVAADDADFEAWANRQFGTDRNRRPKGVVEVML